MKHFCDRCGHVMDLLENKENQIKQKVEVWICDDCAYRKEITVSK